MALNNSFFQGAGGNTAPKRLNAADGRTAGGVYMAKLGDYMFSLDTASFQALQRRSAYVWQRQQRIGRRAAAQFIGIGEDTIQLRGQILPLFRGGIGQVGLMRQAAERGEPLPFIYAFESVGQYCGLWCIDEITEDREVFFADGVPRKIDFAMTISAYGEEEGSAALVAVPGSGSEGLSDLAVSEGFVSAGDAIATLPTEQSAFMDTVQNAAAAISDVTTAAVEMLQPVVDTVQDIATAGANIAGWANQTINSAINSIPAPIRQLIPAKALNYANEAARMAANINLYANQAGQSAGLFSRAPEAIKNVALDLGVKMGEFGSQIANSVSGLSAEAETMASMPPSEDVPAHDRIVAGATMQNLSRAANAVTYAATETQRLANHVAGKIKLNG